MREAVYKDVVKDAIDNLVCSMSVCLNADEYRGMKNMKQRALKAIDAIPAITKEDIYDDGSFDMFLIISSAYYGKQYYFPQDKNNNVIYSRKSGKNLKREEALLEFFKEIEFC